MSWINRRIAACIFISSMIVLPGCWDRAEIEERDYIRGFGVDLLDEEQAEDTHSENIGVREDAKPLYRITIETPMLEEMGEGTQGTADSKKNSTIVSTTGHTPGQLFSFFHDQLPRIPFLGHLRMVVIGEAAARQGIEELLDYVERAGVSDRRFLVLIADGEAMDVIKAVPLKEENITEEIINIIDKLRRSSRVFPGKFHDISVDLFQNGNTILPRVKTKDERLVLGGSAIIKNNRLIGWLGELETQSLLFIKEEAAPFDTIVVADPEEKHEEVTFIIRDHKTIERVKIEGDVVTFRLRFLVEGDLNDQTGKMRREKIWEEDYIEEVNQQLDSELTTRITHVIEKLQKEFQVDVLDWGELVHRQDPRRWQELKEEWDDVYFSQANVELEVEVDIRRIGLTR